jgi:hypothetical protein
MDWAGTGLLEETRGYYDWVFKDAELVFQESAVSESRIQEKKMLKKGLRRFAIIALAGLLVYPGSSAWADSQEIPALKPAADDRIYPPDAGDKSLLDLFYDFDQLYWARQDSASHFPEKWAELGDRFSGILGIRAGEDIYTKFILYSQKTDIEMNVFLRGLLLMGESYLFASQGYFKTNDSRFLTCYEKGIALLEQIVLAADNLAGNEDLNAVGADRLPPYSSPIKKGPLGGQIEFLPYAGFETIGTGFEGPTGPINRKVTYTFSTFGGYHTLTKYRGILKALPIPDADEIVQIPTTRTARELLSHFCPWGVPVYNALKAAGLTEALDFRILRPFSLDTTPVYAKPGVTVLTEVYNSYQSIFSKDPVYASYNVPPVLSSRPLDAEEVPVRVKRAMERIAGEAALSGSSRIHRDVAGNLGGLGKDRIQWFWVGDPTYNIWLVSPRVVNDWDEKDWLGFWFTAVNVWYGGPAGVLAGESVNRFKAFIDHHYGEGPTDIRPLTTIVAEHYDKGLLLPSLYTEGEYLSPTAVVQKIASFAMGNFVDQIRQDNFGNVNPKKLNMGRSYNGDNIPVVMIRCSVLGFESVAQDEYPRLVEAVRFFKAYPELNGSRAPHQMIELHGSAPELNMGGLGWWTFPGLGGSYEIITHFAPEKQVLKFALKQAAVRSIAAGDQVTAELWVGSAPGGTKIAAVPIEPDQRDFTITLFNADNPTVGRDFKDALKKDTLGAAAAINDPDAAAAVDAYLAPKWQKKALSGGHHIAMVSLKTQYELRVNVNGATSAVYPVNMYQNRALRRNEPITGKTSPPAAGVVQLDYDPAIDIPVMKVNKDSLVPGKPSSQ